MGRSAFGTEAPPVQSSRSVGRLPQGPGVMSADRGSAEPQERRARPAAVRTGSLGPADPGPGREAAAAAAGFSPGRKGLRARGAEWGVARSGCGNRRGERRRLRLGSLKPRGDAGARERCVHGRSPRAQAGLRAGERGSRSDLGLWERIRSGPRQSALGERSQAPRVPRAGALVALVFGVGAARAPGLCGHLCRSAHGAPVLTGGTGYGRQVTCSGFIFRDGITACGLGENGGR